MHIYFMNYNKDHQIDPLAFNAIKALHFRFPRLGHKTTIQFLKKIASRESH